MEDKQVIHEDKETDYRCTHPCKMEIKEAQKDSDDNSRESTDQGQEEETVND
jgi:hypothetical protein